MEIYILHDGEQLGPYSGAELWELLEKGSIAASDLAWHDGLEGWVPLSEIVSLPKSKIPPPPPDSPYSSSPGKSPYQPVYFLVGVALLVAFYFGSKHAPSFSTASSSDQTGPSASPKWTSSPGAPSGVPGANPIVQAISSVVSEPGSQFVGIWIKVNGNGSGLMTIENNGSQFLVTEGSQKSGAVLKDGFLMIGDTSPITYIRSSDHITLMDGSEYARQSPAVPLDNRAMSDINSGNYDQAIVDSTAALKLDPNFAAAHLQRGEAYRNKKDYDNAIADYSIGLKTYPNPNNYRERANAYWGKGDYNDAIADCTKAIELEPKNDSFLCTYYDTRANMEEAKGDLDGAIADFTAAHQSNPGELITAYDLKTALVKRGTSAQVKGAFEAAITDYSEALEVSPYMFKTCFYLSFTLRRLHRSDAPAGLATLAAKAATATGNATIWPTAQIRYMTGDLSEEDFLAMAAQGNDDTVRRRQCEAYYYVGMTHLLNSQPAEAQTLFAKCIDTKITDMDEFSLAQAELARLTTNK